MCALMDMMLRDHANIALVRATQHKYCKDITSGVFFSDVAVCGIMVWQEDGAVGHLLASIAESQDVQGEAKAWTLLQHLLQAGGEVSQAMIER